MGKKRRRDEETEETEREIKTIHDLFDVLGDRDLDLEFERLQLG